MDSTEHVGRRIDAAMRLAGATKADIVPELNISVRTLERIISGQRMARDVELRRLADVLNVPLWFLHDGFAGASATVEDDRIEALERKVDQLIAGLLPGPVEGGVLERARHAAAEAPAAAQEVREAG